MAARLVATVAMAVLPLLAPSYLSWAVAAVADIIAAVEVEALAAVEAPVLFPVIRSPVLGAVMAALVLLGKAIMVATLARTITGEAVVVKARQVLRVCLVFKVLAVLVLRGKGKGHLQVAAVAAATPVEVEALAVMGAAELVAE